MKKTLLYNNVIKSYQVKDLGKKKVIGFEDDLDFIKSPDRKGTLKTEIERYTEKLEDLEKEFEARRNELVLLNEEIEKTRQESIDERKRFVEQNAVTAREEGLKIKEEARKEGLREGLEAGRNQLISEFSEFIDYIETLKSGLADQVCKYDIQYKDQIVNLMFSILKVVLQGEDLSDTLKQLLIRNFELACREVEKNQKYNVYINKHDHDTMKDHIQKLYEGYNIELMPELYPSDKVSSGGCIIETQFGTLDVSLESQIGEIYKEFIRLSKEDVSTLS